MAKGWGTSTSAGVAAFVGGMGLLGGLLLTARLFLGAPPVDCAPPPGSIDLAAAEASGLSQEQRYNAAAVVAEGRRRDLPDQAIVIALAVAHQESRFLNYANDGAGSDLMPDQSGIERSLDLPHQAVGTDHGSLGIFQQQWPWWGSMRDLMDPTSAAARFYDSLVQVSGWTTMPLTVAAQAVQRSAFPDAYADDEALARTLLVELLPDVSASAWTSSVSPGCTGAAHAGDVVFPLPAGSRYTDQRNWGAVGTAWQRGHTGTDLSAPCGTPVLAAHGGRVEIRSDQAWSGPWLVMVTTGEGQLTTWYAHMQTLRVAHGQTVRAGQPIGEVGREGNSSGCHLHFEVHPDGGGIYEDGVDPTQWLKDNVGSATSDGDAVAPFTIATFNVLGHSHTQPGGKHPELASGPERMVGTVELLDRFAVDVVGLQELQGIQHRALLELAGDRYAVFSPPGDTENSIAWRRDRWDLVRAQTFPIPYFNGNPRQMPIVELRDRTTGGTVIVINVHNPANTSRFPRQERWRAEALAREARLVTNLNEQTSAPILLVGDLNDRDQPFCVLAAIGMSASNGGSSGANCEPPSDAGIDWIFGQGLLLTKGPVVRAVTSDHPLVVARAEHVRPER